MDKQLVKTKQNVFLQALLQERVKTADAMSERYGNLWRAAEALIKQGGKRHRPYMVWLAYHGYGGKDSAVAVQAGAATELLHLALLIHDDIIDRDLTRYGIKNVAGQYLDEYKSLVKDDTERLHYANSAAIMAGDMLISEGYRLLNTLEGIDPADKQQAVNHFAESLFAVCGGELLDIETALLHDLPAALTIAELKTASYSFMGPLSIGAALAGASSAQIRLLGKFSRSIGMAFQLRDDLIGVFGNPKLTGKTNVGDIREGKRTFLIEQFYALGSSADQRTFEKVFNVTGLEDTDYQKAARLLEKSGAKAACERQIMSLCNDARTSLVQMSINSQSQQAFDSYLTSISSA